MKTWPPEGPPLRTNFSLLRILLHSTANRLLFDAGERCCRQSMTEYQARKKSLCTGPVISEETKMQKIILKAVVRFLLIATLCAGAGSFGYGQSAVDGAIGGTVQDSSGLAIPKATVTIRNNATNAEQIVEADDSGFFRAIHLQPSTYTVTVSAAGFENFKSPGVIVQVGLLTDLSPKLPVGSAAQTVGVTSEAPAINTTSPDFAGVVDQRALQDLPVSNYR